MQVHSLASLHKQLSQQTIRSLLILSKQKEEREDVLHSICLKDCQRFDRENFDSRAFISEFESQSFLTKERMIVVDGVDKLPLAALEKAVCQPSPSIVLVLMGETAPSSLQKSVEVVFKMGEKKGYEKENELSRYLVEEAKAGGCTLSLDVAHIWVKSFGMDKQLLKRELEKLLCYMGYQGEISLALVREFSIALPHLTLWQLGDALFSCSRKEAWQVLHALLEEGGSIFQILSHLRSQFESGIKQLAAHKKGSLAEDFPYLKGGLGRKKIALLSNFGSRRLKRALTVLFETELQAKNSTIDGAILLETLIVRLTA